MKYHRITFIHDEVIDEARSFDDGVHHVHSRTEALELINKWNRQAINFMITRNLDAPRVMYYL